MHSSLNFESEERLREPGNIYKMHACMHACTHAGTCMHDCMHLHVENLQKKIKEHFACMFALPFGGNKNAAT